jgi:hypothetical protein
VAAKGNALAPALEEGQDVLIHATGYDAAGKETGTVTMTFASKDKLIKEWTKWDLSSLGKVAKVRFNMTGGPDNGYGFSQPAYFAYDDVAVRFEKAAAVVNPPGYSEHNCGLAADLNSPEHTGLDEGFENTAAFRWLCQHAGEYGFILRYPKGAEEKTEITYEPWHWRYVGVENAAKINASGLCFEDYIAALQQIAG